MKDDSNVFLCKLYTNISYHEALHVFPVVDMSNLKSKPVHIILINAYETSFYTWNVYSGLLHVTDSVTLSSIQNWCWLRTVLERVQQQFMNIQWKYESV